MSMSSGDRRKMCCRLFSSSKAEPVRSSALERLVGVIEMERDHCPDPMVEACFRRIQSVLVVLAGEAGDWVVESRRA